MEDQHNSSGPSAELEGYTREELTIHASKAKWQTILYAMPFMILFGGAYFLWWGSSVDDRNLYWLMGGLFFTFASGGDFMIVNQLRKLPMDTLVQDYPEKLGRYVYKAV